VVALAPADFVRSDEALSRTWTEPEAEQYTRWLATHHYENFHVVSFLLPKHLHQDFYNVYSFCRWRATIGYSCREASLSRDIPKVRSACLCREKQKTKCGRTHFDH